MSGFGGIDIRAVMATLYAFKHSFIEVPSCARGSRGGLMGTKCCDLYGADIRGATPITFPEVPEIKLRDRSFQCSMGIKTTQVEYIVVEQT